MVQVAVGPAHERCGSGYLEGFRRCGIGCLKGFRRCATGCLEALEGFCRLCCSAALLLLLCCCAALLLCCSDEEWYQVPALALRQLKPADTTVVTIRTITVIRRYDYSPNKRTCAADTTVVTIDIDSQSPAKVLKRDVSPAARNARTIAEASVDV